MSTSDKTYAQLSNETKIAIEGQAEVIANMPKEQRDKELAETKGHVGTFALKKTFDKTMPEPTEEETKAEIKRRKETQITTASGLGKL